MDVYMNICLYVCVRKYICEFIDVCMYVYMCNGLLEVRWQWCEAEWVQRQLCVTRVTGCVVCSV